MSDKLEIDWGSFDINVLEEEREKIQKISELLTHCLMVSPRVKSTVKLSGTLQIQGTEEQIRKIMGWFNPPGSKWVASSGGAGKDSSACAELTF